MRWLKIAAISTILFYVIYLLKQIPRFGIQYLLSHSDIVLFESFIFSIILSVISLFVFYGYIRLAAYIRNKFLHYTGWIVLIFVIIGLFSEILLFSLFRKTIFFYANASIIPILPYPTILSFIISVIFLIPYLLLGIALQKEKTLGFTKATGIFIVINGLFAMMVLLFMLAPVFGDIRPIGNFLIVIALPAILINKFISPLVFIILSILSIIMFFKASKQFENNSPTTSY